MDSFIKRGSRKMLNKFVGIGRWAKDIEFKVTPNGKAVANSDIALNDSYGDKENTTFLPVVMWGKTAENVANHSGKGRLIAIEGRIQVRSWESENGKRYVTEIVAENVRFLDRGRDEAKPQNQDPFQDDGKPIDLSSDNLPF